MGGITSLLAPAKATLEIRELERLVDDLAGHPDLWREHVRHAREQRIYTQLHREPHLDVWLMLETVEHSAGARFSFDATYIHDVRHDGGAPATSLHAYSPALWRTGHYALGPRGLGHTSLTHLDVIQPERLSG